MKVLNNTSISKIFNLIKSKLVVVGAIQAFAGPTVPTGWLLCDGSAVSRTTYAKLFAIIGTTYGTGDGSTTFNLPNLTDRFIQGSSTSGTTKAAGLPNITGKVGLHASEKANIIYAASGSFYGDSSHNGAYRTTGDLNEHSGAYSYGGVGFNASSSNSIYGNSTTVQPPALTLKYIIKY